MIDNKGIPVIRMTLGEVTNPKEVMNRIGSLLLQGKSVRVHTGTSEYVIETLRDILEPEFIVQIKDVSGGSLRIRGYRKKSRDGKPLEWKLSMPKREIPKKKSFRVSEYDEHDSVVRITTKEVLKPEIVMSKIGSVLLQKASVTVHTATSMYVIQKLRTILAKEFIIRIKDVRENSLLVQGFRKKNRKGTPLESRMLVAKARYTPKTSAASRKSKPSKKKTDRLSDLAGKQARVLGRSGCIIKLENKRILEHSSGAQSRQDVEVRISQIKQLLSSKRKFSNEERNDLIGAIGELKTIQALLDLGGEYVVFNNVRLGFEPGFRISTGGRRDWVMSQQIDHVVIGPTGIFVIESKNWGYETIVDSVQSKGYTPIKQATRCEKALNRFLREAMKTKVPYVKAVVALSGSGLFAGDRKVKVVTVDGLCNHIKSMHKTVTPKLVDRVASIISSRRTDEKSLWVSTKRKSRRKRYR